MTKLEAWWAEERLMSGTGQRCLMSDKHWTHGCKTTVTDVLPCS